MSLSFSEKLMLLHRVVTQNYNDLETLLAEYLSVGCEIYGMDLGVASHIVGDKYTVDSVSENPLGLKRGIELDLKDTCCFEVYKQNKTLYFHDATEEDKIKNHPVYQTMNLLSYISTPIHVSGQIYGTLSFSSQKKKEGEFSHEDIEIIELMSQSVGRFIEVRQHKEKAESSAKLALIGQMAGGIAHEINNPMAVISSNDEFVLNYLKQKGTLDKDVEESLQAIKQTVKRVRDIVSGLKVIMGGGTVAVEPVKLRDLIDSTMAVVWDKFKRARIEIINDVSPEIMVFANQVQLSQVILNLAQNSHDAILKNENLWINFSAEKRGGFVELAVKDSGTGLSEELAHKIMEPFYTTKETGKGTGLGLSLSKSIIENFGGEFVYDHQSLNTCFKIRLSDAQVRGRTAS